ncbi:glycosyltransferase [Aliarcobacter cryaerophilus]|jgi:glycosyltransferase involved in cell wall biosynthesis|uniref:glycosyltransferase n=1 Tax=Aliarcobacter cryaerophilus TaxID=28198 RepID=UPI000EB4223E|nr:glycosyltransferase family 2 protein [Aliarcobacter cryaerophilus]AYJ77325.1 glycosyltransferase, family 2 [Aliarcobacter cryaerophilus D2610]QNM92457.1 glycosyltransferase family 2 protein [Aliarcobacter cryaerophilus]
MYFDIAICIITYNRGKRALENVENILKNIKKNFCVLVLNNGSNLGVKEYKRIEDLSKENSQLFYKRHKTNLQVHGNFRACFDFNHSKYIMILSDEDFVNIDGLDDILNDLKNYNNVAACRTSIEPHKDLITPGNSYIYPNEYFMAGVSALNGFSFFGNYISGIIYNLELIKKTDLLNILDRHINSHQSYPHLYFDLLVASIFDIILTSKVAVIERHAEQTLIENGTSKISSAHIGLYGYPERTKQFLAFRDAIQQSVELVGLKTDGEKINLFINLFFKLVYKYFFLIFEANINNYTSNYMEKTLLMESFFYLISSSVVEHPYIGSNQAIVTDYLIKIYQEHKERLLN